MKNWLWRSIAALALSGALAACDDANETRPHTHPDADDSEALYVVATSFETGEQRETYLVTTDRFDDQTEIEPTNGPKILGGVVPIAHAGAVYVPDAGRPVILRYEPG